MRSLKRYISSILILTLVIINLLLLKSLLYKTSVATFDIKGTAHTFAVQLASNKKLSSKQKIVLSKQFAEISKKNIDQYSKEHNLIILVKSSTLATSNDVTNIIQKKISESMQEIKR